MLNNWFFYNVMYSWGYLYFSIILRPYHDINVISFS